MPMCIEIRQSLMCVYLCSRFTRYTYIYTTYLCMCVWLCVCGSFLTSLFARNCFFPSLYVTNLPRSLDGIAIKRNKKLYVTRFLTLSFLTWMRHLSLLVQHSQYTFWQIPRSAFGDNLFSLRVLALPSPSPSPSPAPLAFLHRCRHLCLITIFPGKVPWQRHNQLIDPLLLARVRQHG